ncbi:MAG: hypothetical protein JOZ37_12185 [Actinobacteria bacterium]|nr:hypothetical protein [Actinomycetota bacterium]MBV9934408.1 hypothetical protein [Actinomycetota bacterium]
MSNPNDPTLPAEPPSVPPASPPAPPPVPPYTTPPAGAPPVPPYGAGGPPEPPFVPPPPSQRPTGLIVGLGVAVVALAAVAFFVGRSTVHQGPKTLLAAFNDAQRGKLPCGTPAPSGNLPGNGGLNGGANGGANGGGGGRGFGGGAFLGRICNNGANGGANGGGNGGAAGPNGGFGRFGAGGGGALGGLLGPGATTGTVVSVNGDQLTIQTRAGNLTITLPAGVNITKTTAGAVGDLANGSVVVVTSTTDSTGKRTAQRIFILPAGTPAPNATPPSTATG